MDLRLDGNSRSIRQTIDIYAIVRGEEGVDAVGEAAGCFGGVEAPG